MLISLTTYRETSTALDSSEIPSTPSVWYIRARFSTTVYATTWKTMTTSQTYFSRDTISSSKSILIRSVRQWVSWILMPWSQWIPTSSLLKTWIILTNTTNLLTILLSTSSAFPSLSLRWHKISWRESMKEISTDALVKGFSTTSKIRDYRRKCVPKISLTVKMGVGSFELRTSLFTSSP